MSTWRYVSEARAHLMEVYTDLLGMSFEPPIRCFVGMNITDEQMATNNRIVDDWSSQKMARLMQIVAVLDRLNIAAAIEKWREQAISYLRKTPSARARVKFEGEDQRIAFLCVVLWYARSAVNWLQARDDEGLLRGGISYREMTADAAIHGARGEDIRMTGAEILPEDDLVHEEFEEGDPRLDSYLKWTYLDPDSPFI